MYLKNFKKVTSLVAISSLVLSMTACEFGPMTTEKLLTKMEEKAFINEAVVEQIIKDDVITGAELEVIAKNIKSFKGDAKIDFVGGVEMSMDGMSQSVDVEASVGADYQYDSSTKSLMAKANIEASAMGEEIDEEISLYLVNEDGTYYSYSQTNDDVAYREMVADADEVWGDLEISVDDILDEFGLESTDDLVDLFNLATMKEYEDYITLSKDKVEFNGNDCYELVLSIEGAMLLDKANNNEDLQEALEDEMGMSYDEVLEMEILEGYTMEDLLKDFNIDVTYYVHAEDFYVSYMELDLKPIIEELGNTIVMAALQEMGTEYGDAEVSINIEKATISTSYIEDEDVSVEFDGEYEEY